MKPLHAVDSSVIIAAFASWHEAHAAALDALDLQPVLVAHCALEAYSVLTRLPAPHRADAALVVAFLSETFRGPAIALPAKRSARLPAELAAVGISGGATYDGLVAMTAAARGALLLTLDARAEATYRRCGVRYELLAR